MKTRKLYKYIGRNGSITTPILLEDARHIPLMELKAEDGYILRNENNIAKYTVIVHVDEVNSWVEVPADINE